MKTEYMELILEVLILLIGLYLIFAKSYVTEKGKNLATLEDIEEITNKVELIRTNFIKETERLKIDLQYTNQIKFSVKTEELKCLLDYYEKYYFWLNSILDFSFTKYNENNHDSLSYEEEILKNAYFNFLNSEAKAELFVDNDELFAQSKELKLKSKELHNHVTESMIEYSLAILQYKKEEINAKIASAHFDRGIEYKPISQFLEKFHEKRLALYKIISPLISDFKQNTFKHLDEINK